MEVMAQEDISGRVVIYLLTDFQRISQYPLCMYVWTDLNRDILSSKDNTETS